jgi:hypothetical protein
MLMREALLLGNRQQAYISSTGRSFEEIQFSLVAEMVPLQNGFLRSVRMSCANRCVCFRVTPKNGVFAQVSRGAT